MTRRPWIAGTKPATRGLAIPAGPTIEDTMAATYDRSMARQRAEEKARARQAARDRGDTIEETMANVYDRLNPGGDEAGPTAADLARERQAELDHGDTIEETMANVYDRLFPNGEDAEPAQLGPGPADWGPAKPPADAGLGPRPAPAALGRPVVRPHETAIPPAPQAAMVRGGTADPAEGSVHRPGLPTAGVREPGTAPPGWGQPTGIPEPAPPLLRTAAAGLPNPLTPNPPPLSGGGDELVYPFEPSYNPAFEKQIAELESKDWADTGLNKHGEVVTWGRWQLQRAALEDAGLLDAEGNWTGHWGVFSEEDFLRNKDAQQRAFDAYLKQMYVYTRRPPGTSTTWGRSSANELTKESRSGSRRAGSWRPPTGRDRFGCRSTWTGRKEMTGSLRARNSRSLSA